MKTFRYALEALLLYLLFGIFKILPVQTASNTGGWLGRTIGPHLATSRKALRNIQLALPNLSTEQHQAAIKDMWDNLGRIMAEYPHIETIAEKHVQVENKKHLLNAHKTDQSLIVFSAHMGNWEIFPATILKHLDIALDITYRAPNNPWSDQLLIKARTLRDQIKAYSKSRAGGRGMVEALKQNRNIAILIDQKYNEGLSVPFFNIPAMTNPVFVQLAQKYNSALVPIRIERTQGANFKLSPQEPMELFNKDGTPLPVEDVITKAHEYLENWIKKKPGQWLWLHRRWDSAKTDSN